MHAIIHHASALHGALRVPPDKSVCHRAVFLAAVAEGATEIRPWPAADDCQRTLELVERLGVPVSRSPEAVRLEGRGLRGLRAFAGGLSCGESGTTLRLAAGLLAGQPFVSRLEAAPGLSRRPMRRIVEPLTQMGARIEGRAIVASERSESNHDVYPPLTIHGAAPLRAIRYILPVASAQVKSAVLLAGLSAHGRTVVVERQPTRDHTERMLRTYGVAVDRHGEEMTLQPSPPRSPGLIELPGDVSSAAFFLVAAACVAGSRVTLHDVGLNPTRTGIVDLLRRMGAGLEMVPGPEADEPRGSLTIEARSLRGITVEPADIPGVIDELPALMVAAACAQGRSRFHGVGELRVKETDRLRSMVDGLSRLGARVRVPEPDTVEIEGGSLTGAEVDSAADHRTAMSLAVAGLVARGTTTVRGAECVAKSFPEFFAVLGSLAGSPTVKTVDKA